LSRVTRLDDFSTTWSLFTLGSLKKMNEIAQIFGLIFFHGKRYA
jgi:hypothetical protein